MTLRSVAALIVLPAMLVACTSHPARRSEGSATAPGASTPAATASAQSTAPTAVSSAPPASTAVSSAPPPSTAVSSASTPITGSSAVSTAPSPSPSSTVIVGGSAWSSHVLVITGHSLGGVSIGMSSAEAARAAGVSAFTDVGDGVLEPSGPLGSSQPRLFLSNFAGQPAASFRGDFLCVEAAGSASATQSVVTAAGLHLGDPAARVREIYGAAATFIPEPTGGIETHPGYVVHQGQFDLVFKLDSSQSHVLAIAGGIAPMTPSECNG